MLYILSRYYEQNSAPTNHALSFIKGFSELGVKAEWVFLIPWGDFAHCDKDFPGIRMRYLWKEKIARNRVFRHLYKHWAYARFFFSLKKGDKVLLLGMGEYLHFLVRRKGIKVYHERTEHPQAVRASKYSFFNRHYNNDCSRADGIFVISHALKTYFESIGVAPERTHVINMVVDSNRFKNIKKENSTVPYIAYCGKASNLKDGVDDLIKAFAIVASKRPKVQLYIIGEPPAKESDNHDLVEQLGVSDRIVFTGVVPASRMPQLLTNAQMLALARPNSLQNKYGFPTKLGEYLLTGNPVVVTRVGDIPLFLEHGLSAMMSDCRDVNAFAENIIWILDHPEEARIIGQKGKEVAEANFNYLKETKKMYNIMFGDNNGE